LGLFIQFLPKEKVKNDAAFVSTIAQDLPYRIVCLCGKGKKVKTSNLQG